MDGGGKAGKGKSSKGGGNKGGVTTLSDLHRHVESDSDSDGPQEYYTGGEKSGMMVQDPTSRHGRRDIDSIFDRARESGAREGFIGAPVEPARGSFAGTGRTLAGEERLPEPQEDADIAASPVFHTITFWRNGFTVDNGPLRAFDDPANGAFLASINKTECPRELEPATRDTPVHVNLVRREEDWQAPKEPKQVVAFQGTGRTLGSSTAAANSAPIPPRDPGNQPFQGLVVDDKKPSTSLQLRLSDGTRMVARFNHHHTVADVRGFIDASRPGATGSYQLQTMGFPPKQLTDPLQTIEQAGLINAVVIQKAG